MQRDHLREPAWTRSWLAIAPSAIVSRTNRISSGRAVEDPVRDAADPVGAEVPALERCVVGGSTLSQFSHRDPLPYAAALRRARRVGALSRSRAISRRDA
jgi:hypothetical protein